MTKEKEYLEIVLQLKDWHNKKIESFQMILNADEKTKIMIQNDEGHQLELPEKYKEGFMLGIQLAIETLTPFPVNITKS